MDVTVRRSEVLRYLGHARQEIDGELEARIDAAIELAQSRLRPRSAWTAFDLDYACCDDTGFSARVLGTPLVLGGLTARRYLDGARRVAVMACTLGAESERMLLSLGAKDPLGSVVFDAACTSYVEAEADKVQAEIEVYARAHGLRSGSRFSPGYGDLKLEVQPMVLSVLDASCRLGLYVNEAFMLMPSKSVTAFVGLFETEVRGESPSGCDVCALRDSCSMRRRGTPCLGGVAY